MCSVLVKSGIIMFTFFNAEWSHVGEGRLKAREVASYSAV